MVTINVVSCHISAVYGRNLKIPKATCHALRKLEFEGMPQKFLLVIAIFMPMEA